MIIFNFKKKMNYIKTFLLVLTFSFLFNINANANSFEITDYTVSITGIFHDVTIAFDDLNHAGIIRCVIYKKDGGPVGMKQKYINGVGTIQIRTAGITGTKASCQNVN